ncbi:hypothetical protein K491DRAFT_468731 [Lophiostoma macrostomum CBS 122681]|uniref:Uncharacterized protein n=1 Tax=Lophiostoma macrostomum CBS 122681 TaxID=1314788 RepID=A0A6A6T397_9PLEO|nr:hypothetical protein K491DRAFT_468731 [Lophiostoma macrostomum CBS 122681]
MTLKGDSGGAWSHKWLCAGLYSWRSLVMQSVRMNGPERRCWSPLLVFKEPRLPTSLCCAWLSWAADKLLELLPRDAVRFAELTSLKPGSGDDASDTDDTAIMRHGSCKRGRLAGG